MYSSIRSFIGGFLREALLKTPANLANGGKVCTFLHRYGG